MPLYQTRALRIAVIICIAMGLASTLPIHAAPTDGARERRDPAIQPFTATSIWNTPLGRDAQFVALDAPETRQLHSENVGGRAGAYSWIAVGAFGVYQAHAADPIRRWYYDRRSATAAWPGGGALSEGSIALRTPPTIRFLGGSDGHAVLIDPSGQIAYEVWHGRWDEPAKAYRATYLVRTDLRGLGIASGEGRSEGIRSFGGSLVGGMIRCEDLRRGEIRHAVAVVLSTTQLRKAPTMSGQKVWPAMVSDGGGHNTYEGLIPLGALVAIPQGIDLEALGLSQAGLALARAYQRFGGYAVDAATKTMVLGVAEAGCDPALTKGLQTDKRTIRALLRRVDNNSADHPGGPGARVSASPPPLADPPLPR